MRPHTAATPYNQLDPTSPTRAACRRAWCAFGAFALGITAARSIELAPAVWFSTALIAAGVALALRSRAYAPVVLISLALLGAGWFALRIQTTPADSVVRLLPPSTSPAERTLLRVEGIVLDTPELWDPPRDALDPPIHTNPPTRFTIAARAAMTDSGPIRVRGSLRVYAAEIDPTSLHAGDRVQLVGIAHAPRPPMNPGDSDARLWAAQDGHAGTIRTDNAELIAINPEPWLPSLALDRVRRPLLRSVAELYARAEAALSLDRADPATRELLSALILGRRDPGESELTTAVQRLGASHLLAISGLHVGLVALAAAGLVRMTGDRPKLETVALVAAVVLYLVLVPARAPIIRAGVIVLALAGAGSLARRVDRLTLLGWVGVGLLVWRPLDAAGLGFQLSLGITALLLWLGHERGSWIGARPLRGIIPRPERPRERLARWARATIVSAVLCWLAATPFIIHHTGVLSPFAPLATILLTLPVIATLALGLLAVIAGLISPGIAAPCSAAARALADVTASSAMAAESLPGAWVQLPHVSIVWVIAAMLALALWLAWWPRRRGVRWIVTFAITAWFAIEGFVIPRLATRPPLRLDMLAVGDGTCILVRTPRHTMLWDAGSLTPGLARDRLPRALHALGVRTIDTAVLTHPNLDHYNGMPILAEQFGIARFITSRATTEQAEANSHSHTALLLDQLRAYGVPIATAAAGDSLEFAVFLWPNAGDAAVRGLGLNDQSLVLHITIPTDAGVRTVLLTGDIQRDAMVRLLDGPLNNVHIDAIELPHHGSAHAVAYEFVASLAPHAVFQSTGPSRVDDPRWASVRANTTWHTTASDGAATLTITEDGRLLTRTMRDEW